MSRTIELALKHFGETHMANAAFREKVEAFRNAVLAEAAEVCEARVQKSLAKSRDGIYDFAARNDFARDACTERACAAAIEVLQTKEGGS